jgi:carbamoyl-phosphate synthase large subunit
LFWEVPVPRQYGAQTMIGPRGQVGPHLLVRARMRLGRVESQHRFADEDLREVALSAARVLAEAGWRGPMNVQARPTQAGWRIIEYGGRFTGGTSARLHLGLDEVGWTLNEWAGREVVPPPSHPTVDHVRRFLTDAPVGQPRGGLGGTTAVVRLA